MQFDTSVSASLIAHPSKIVKQNRDSYLLPRNDVYSLSLFNAAQNTPVVLKIQFTRTMVKEQVYCRHKHGTNVSTVQQGCQIEMFKKSQIEWEKEPKSAKQFYPLFNQNFTPNVHVNVTFLTIEIYPQFHFLYTWIYFIEGSGAATSLPDSAQNLYWP